MASPDKTPFGIHLNRGYVIERYEYQSLGSDRQRVQWIVHEIRDPGVWHQWIACDTLHEASEWLAEHTKSKRGVQVG